jgi:hypothetical protein
LDAVAAQQEEDKENQMLREGNTAVMKALYRLLHAVRFEPGQTDVPSTVINGGPDEYRQWLKSLL